MALLIELTKQIFDWYVDKNNNILKEPIGFVGKLVLEENRNEFIGEYLNLIINTKIVSDDTRLYLRSKSRSVRAAVEDYNETVGEAEQKNYNTIKSKVDYDRRKLLKYFPDDMLNKVLYSAEWDLDLYNKQLNLAISNYSGKYKMLDNLNINIPKVDIVDYLNEDDFIDFIKVISPFTKSHMKYIEDNIPKDSAGYFRYLITTPQLKGEHLERYKIIKEMLN